MAGRSLTVVYPDRISPVNKRHKMHYHATAAENAVIRQYVWAIARQRWKGAPADAVWIEFLQTTRTRRMPDPDACQGASKPFIDGLADADVIPDDTGRYVHGITYYRPEWTGTDSLVCRVAEIDGSGAVGDRDLAANKERQPR